jgi:hypothetical protein
MNASFEFSLDDYGLLHILVDIDDNEIHAEGSPEDADEACLTWDANFSVTGGEIQEQSTGEVLRGDVQVLIWETGRWIINDTCILDRICPQIEAKVKDHILNHA